MSTRKTMVKERVYLIPSMYQMVHDDPIDSGEINGAELARHFDDLYKLYLRRLGEFEMRSEVDNAREQELTVLLAELIKLKKKLQEAD